MAGACRGCGRPPADASEAEGAVTRPLLLGGVWCAGCLDALGLLQYPYGASALPLFDDDEEEDIPDEFTPYRPDEDDAHDDDD